MRAVSRRDRAEWAMPMPRAPRRGPALAAGIYLALVLAATAIAAWRLSESTELPGLAAVELLLLAMPWSLLLGVAPIAHAPLAAAAGVVFSGVAVNIVLIARLTTWVQRRVGGFRRPSGT